MPATSALALLCKAEALEAWGQRAQALRLLEAASVSADLAGSTAALDLCFGRQKILEGKLGDALVLLSGRRGEDFKDLFAGYRGLALARLGRDRDARPLLEAALEVRTWSAFRKALAGVLIRAGEASRAAVLLDAEQDPRGWLLYGTSLEARGRSLEALAVFRRALPFLLDDRAMQWACATSFTSIGHFNAALKHYRRLLPDYPDDPELHLRAGLCLALAGLQAEALGEFQRVLELDPEHRLARREQCRALLKLGRYRPAVRLLEKAGLDDDEALLLRAAGWERLGELDRAESALAGLRVETPFARFFAATLRDLRGQDPRPGPPLLPPERKPAPEDEQSFPFSLN